MSAGTMASTSVITAPGSTIARHDGSSLPFRRELGRLLIRRTRDVAASPQGDKPRRSGGPALRSTHPTRVPTAYY